MLDFPNLLPYDALMKVGNLTNLKILLDLLILIWDYFGCNVHDQCLAKFLFFFLCFIGLLLERMLFAMCIIYSYNFLDKR